MRGEQVGGNSKKNAAIFSHSGESPPKEEKCGGTVISRDSRPREYARNLHPPCNMPVSCPPFSRQPAVSTGEKIRCCNSAGARHSGGRLPIHVNQRLKRAFPHTTVSFFRETVSYGRKTGQPEAEMASVDFIPPAPGKAGVSGGVLPIWLYYVSQNQFCVRSEAGSAVRKIPLPSERTCHSRGGIRSAL